MTALHEPTGLCITEVIGMNKFSNVPRACALSCLAHYVGRFASTTAREICEKHFLRNTILGTGFPESRENFKYRWTPDLGSIPLGLSGASTDTWSQCCFDPA